MKPRFTSITIATALLLSAGGLLSQQDSALASPEGLTPQQANQLSHDLVPSRSQEFFREGQKKIDEEIQHLDQTQRSSKEPVLKIMKNPQEELDRLPQIKPDNLNQH